MNHPQRVHLDIQVGEHTNNYAEIAAKDKLTELQLRVRQLVEQVDQIQKEQNYQRVSTSAVLLSKALDMPVVFTGRDYLAPLNRGPAIIRLTSLDVEKC